MRHLVRQHEEDAAPRGVRIGCGIEQQPAFEKGDAAPVLHGAAEPAGHRDQIELGQRIFHAEIVVEPGEQFHCVVERKAPLFALARGGDHADGDVIGLRREPFEFARREHEQIGRHFRRRRKGDLFQVRRDRRLAYHRHVADREVRARQGYRERERRLEGGLIPARENPPRVGRFELAREHALHALAGRIIDNEQAGAELVDPRGEGDAQPVRADGERLRKSERRGLSGGIERDVGALRIVVDGDGAECRVDRVQNKPRGGLAHLDVDDFDARQREAFEIGCEFDGIMDRNDRFRQFSGRGIEGIAGLGHDAGRHRHDECDHRSRHGSEVTHREYHRDHVL